MHSMRFDNLRGARTAGRLSPESQAAEINSRNTKVERRFKSMTTQRAYRLKCNEKARENARSWTDMRVGAVESAETTKRTGSKAIARPTHWWRSARAVTVKEGQD